MNNSPEFHSASLEDTFEVASWDRIRSTKQLREYVMGRLDALDVADLDLS